MTFLRLLLGLFKLYRRPSSYIGFILCLLFSIVSSSASAGREYKGRDIGGSFDPASTQRFYPSSSTCVHHLAAVVTTVAGNQHRRGQDGTLRHAVQ
jgi:hypothetical protein